MENIPIGVAKKKGSGKAVKRSRAGNTALQNSHGKKNSLSKSSTSFIDRVQEDLEELTVQNGNKISNSFKGSRSRHSTPHGSSSNSSSAAPSPPSAPSPPPPASTESTEQMETEANMEGTEETPSTDANDKTLKSLAPLSSYKKNQMEEQQKFLQDFNPRNSLRMRRKYNRIMDYNDNPKLPKQQETLVHDHKGRFIDAERHSHDMCDCLRTECPGCHFPCPKCRSLKCGSECRSNRKWYYEVVDVEGTDQHITNKFSK